MIQEASFTGLIRMIFIIVGVIVVLRFIGRILIAKREKDKLNELDAKKRQVDQEKENAKKNAGKISVHSSNDSLDDRNTIDVDYEES